MKDEDLHSNLPWQTIAALFGFFVGLPLVFVGSMFIFTMHGYGTLQFGLIAYGLAAPCLIWCAFGLRSRLVRGAAVGEPISAFTKPLSIGLGIILGGTLLILIEYAILPASGGVYVLPGGMYLSGAVVIVRAMSPPQEAPKMRARNIKTS
jgi:hypothetical protein